MENKNTWKVYIGQCQDSSFYTGITQNVEARAARHNANKGSHHVQQHGHIKILWTEEHAGLTSARIREIQIKGWTRQKKQAIIKGDTVLLKRL